MPPKSSSITAPIKLCFLFISIQLILGCVSTLPQQKVPGTATVQLPIKSPLELAFDKDPLCLPDVTKTSDGPSCVSIFPQIGERNAPVVRTDVFYLPKNVFWPYETCEIMGIRNLKIQERRTDTVSKLQTLSFSADYYLICKHIFNATILAQNGFIYKTQLPQRYSNGRSHLIKFSTDGVTTSQKFAEGWKAVGRTNSINPNGKAEFIRLW